VERNNTKYALLERKDTKAANVAVVQKMTDQGMVFNRVDQTPFRAPLRPYYENWANTFGATEWGLLQTAIGKRLV
jgi:TRAP-type C4-dicarboxylate transport system substrate-binding protein